MADTPTHWPTRDKVSRKVEDALFDLFEAIEVLRPKDMPPSEMARLLDGTTWGLGDDYRDWWQDSDADEEWT